MNSYSINKYYYKCVEKIQSFISVRYEQDARERLRGLQNVDDFNTQLSFVSFVGGRGNGKSTIAALLAGNSTMFKVNIKIAQL